MSVTATATPPDTGVAPRTFRIVVPDAEGGSQLSMWLLLYLVRTRWTVYQPASPTAPTPIIRTEDL